MDRFFRCLRLGTLAGASLCALAITQAQSKVLEVKITEVQSPTFDGQSFEDAGQYERIQGTVIGAIDPTNPLNADIADIGLAPKNASGLVEYQANFMIFRPMDPRKGNHKVLYEINN